MAHDTSYKASAIRVFVHDWERALRFYSETLGMPVEYQSSDMGWAEFDTGECHIAIERLPETDPESSELVGRYVGVTLSVPNIDATYAELRGRGVKFVGAPARQPWGGVLAHLEDSEGNTLTLLGAS